MDLYRQEILHHYKNPHNFGTIDHPTMSASMVNTACGDKIRIDILTKMEKDGMVISDIKFSGVGCAISIASGSLLTEKVKGMLLSDVKLLTPEIIYEMLGMTLTPSRVKCAVLPLEVIHKAIG